ncbi:hypothetical protein Nmel_004341 [Mimus melanotis]
MCVSLCPAGGVSMRARVLGRGGCVSGRRPVSQGGPSCCCGKQCGGRGGADGGPGGEAPCGGRGCSLLAAFPPRRPRSRRLFPVCLVRAEAGPRRQCRRARDPPHAPGSASVWLRSGRRAAGMVVSAGALQSFRPGLNSAAGAARVWETRRRGRGCSCWVKGGVWRQSLLPPPRRGPERLRSKGWAGTAGRGQERRGAVGVADSCCDSRALRCLPATGRSLVLTEGLCCPRAERGRCWKGASSPMYFSTS